MKGIKSSIDSGLEVGLDELRHSLMRRESIKSLVWSELMFVYELKSLKSSLFAVQEVMMDEALSSGELDDFKVTLQ
jgi:hypothetical protein